MIKENKLIDILFKNSNQITMDKNKNVTELIAHYQSIKRTKQDKVIRRSQNFSANKVADSRWKENDNKNIKLKDALSPSQLETLAHSSNDQKMFFRKESDSMTNQPSKFKIGNTRQRYSTSRPLNETRFSNEQNQSIDSKVKFKQIHLNKFSHSIVNRKIFETEMNKVQVKLSKAFKTCDIRHSNDDTNDKSEIKEERQADPDIDSNDLNLDQNRANIANFEDSEPNTDSLDNSSVETKSYQLNFHPLPSTLSEFPDDVDPIDFFSQQSTILSTFNDYIRDNYSTKLALQFTKHTNSSNIKFTSSQIELVDLINKRYKIHIPFSISYLLISLPYLAQLCLINMYISNFLKVYKRMSDTIDIKVFGETLDKLCGVESARNTIISFRSCIKKSQFGNAHLNSVFIEKEESCDSRSKNISRSNAKKSNMKHQKNELNRSANGKRTKTIGNFETAELNTNNVLNNLSDVHGEQSNTENNHLRKKFTDFIEEITEQDISLMDTVSNKTSSSDTSINLLDNQDVTNYNSSSDSESLEESEYTSKNPFEIKYALVSYKFKSYTINMIKPSMASSTNKFIRYLGPDDLRQVFDIQNENLQEVFNEVTK